MVETSVRTVTLHPQSGRPIAVLRPCADDGSGLALPISKPEACALAHELAGRPSQRQQSLVLLARCLHTGGGRIAAIRIVPGADGAPSARLELEWPAGRADEMIPIGQALGLAVTLGMPVLVAEALLSDRTPTVASASPPASIPAAFHRAFER